MIKKILYIIFAITFFTYFNVNADAKLKDGWHLLPSKTNSSKKVWAYYKNGEEKIRLRKMIYIHSGWNTTPENSLASLKTIKKNGYYALTIDINFTKDNIPILIHDETINWAARNPDLSKISQTLYVKDMTLKEIQKYDFVVSRSGNVLENYKGNKVTTYEEALDYCRKNGLTLEVEIKKGTKSQIQSLVELTQKYNMDGVIKWTSFSSKHLKYINEYDNNEVLQLLTYDNSQTAIDNAYNSLNLKNGKNTLIYGEDDGYYHVPDMPEQKASYPISNYTLSTIPKATLTLNNSNINIHSGQTSTIKYTYNGDGKLKCKSSNSAIINCNIDENKKQITVTPTNNTNTTVTLTFWSTQGIKYSASDEQKLTINIVPLEVLPSEITLNKNTTTLKVGTTEKLLSSITPSNAPNKNITWKSSNTSIATVSNGIVTAKAKGTATITATTSNGKTASCTVTVINDNSNNNNNTNIEITNISLNKNTTTIKIGNTETLHVTINPSNATNKNITWNTSDFNIVNVSNGIITAKSTGTATITATTSNGKTASCIVTVITDNNNTNIEVTDITLNKNKISLKIGNTETLQATINPSNATNKNIIWNTSDSNIVTVSNGIITAKAKGTAIITATTSNGKTASCTITVSEKSSSNNMPVIIITIISILFCSYLGINIYKNKKNNFNNYN